MTRLSQINNWLCVNVTKKRNPLLSECIDRKRVSVCERLTSASFSKRIWSLSITSSSATLSETRIYNLSEDKHRTVTEVFIHAHAYNNITRYFKQKNCKMVQSLNRLFAPRLLGIRAGRRVWKKFLIIDLKPSWYPIISGMFDFTQRCAGDFFAVEKCCRCFKFLATRQIILCMRASFF